MTGQRVDNLQSESVPAAAPAHRGNRFGRLKLLGLFCVCAAPMVAAYLAYYVFPPSGRTHFGTLIEPQRPVPEPWSDGVAHATGAWNELRGKWVLLQVDGGACGQACFDKLYALRQQRAMTGKHRDRVARAWVLADAKVPDPKWQTDYAGTVVLRLDPAVWQAWLPTEPGRDARDYLYVVDPRGHLMMRFDARGDPAKIRRDLARLLRASQIG